MTPEVRDYLENLAAGWFGLDAWVRKSTKYAPPELNQPWREPGHMFAPKDLEVIPFFENLLRASSSDDELGDRWVGRGADRLKFSPLAVPREGRRNRGLTDAPKSAAVKRGIGGLLKVGGPPIRPPVFSAAV